MMRTRLPTLLAFLLIGCTTVQADPASLRIGVYGREPPLSFIDAQGAPRGFDIDVARALCAHLRTPCTLVPTDWDDLIPRVQQGELDAAVASLAITAARRARVQFTRPYSQDPARLVGRAGRFEHSDADSLTGRRIGVPRGTTFDDYLTDVHRDQVRIVRYATTDEALLDLLLGRLDLVLGGQVPLDQGFLRQDQGRGFAFAGAPLTDPRLLGEGLGVAVRPDAPDLRAALDAAVAALTESGVLAHLARRWFGDAALDLSGVSSPGPTPPSAKPPAPAPAVKR